MKWQLYTLYRESGANTCKSNTLILHLSTNPFTFFLSGYGDASCNLIGS